MAERTIVVLEGDQTGQELLEEALRVLDPLLPNRKNVIQEKGECDDP